MSIYRRLDLYTNFYIPIFRRFSFKIRPFAISSRFNLLKAIFGILYPFGLGTLVKVKGFFTVHTREPKSATTNVEEIMSSLNCREKKWEKAIRGSSNVKRFFSFAKLGCCWEQNRKNILEQIRSTKAKFNWIPEGHITELNCQKL